MIAWAAQNAVVTLVLACIVAFACRAGRLGPASRHALWLVVLIKLVTPPLVAWPWGVPIVPWSGEQPERPGVPHAHVTPARDYVVSSEVISISGSSTTMHDPGQSAEAARDVPGDWSNRSAGRTPSRSNTDWQSYVHIVLLGGGLAMAGLHVVRIVHLCNRAVGATPASERLVREVAKAAADLGIRPPRVVLASGIQSPLVWAVGRAALLWPQGLVEREDYRSWRGVIVHELAHLRRRDHWTGWLDLAASCLWWWSPVFWYVRNQLRENAELACDAWVVRTLPDGRRSYAEALLAVCEFDPQTVPPPLPAWGVHGGTRRALERRLTMILRERLPVRVSRGAWIAVTLLAAIAVPNWYLVAEAQPAAENLTETDAIVPAEIPSLPPPFDAPAVETAPSDVSADSAATADAAPPVASSFAAEPAATVRDVPALEPSQSAIPMVSSLRRFPSQQPQPHVVESDSFTLTRTTYRVQPQVAANLKAFLEQNLSWPHLIGIEAKEYSVERENAVASRETLLIVTASPPAQEMIGNLIGLMLESKPRRTDLTDTALPSLNPETDSIEPLSR